MVSEADPAFEADNRARDRMNAVVHYSVGEVDA